MFIVFSFQGTNARIAHIIVSKLESDGIPHELKILNALLCLPFSNCANLNLSSILCIPYRTSYSACFSPNRRFGTTPSAQSGKKDRIIANRLPTNPFYLIGTARAQKIEPDTVLLWLNHSV